MNEIITTTAQELTPVMNDQLVSRWISFIDVKPKSAETYSRNIRPFLNFILERGKRNPADVERADVVEYRDMLTAEGKTPSTVTAYMNAVRLLFKWLKAEGVITVNPAENVKAAKPDAGFKKEAISARRAGNLLESVSTENLTGKRDYAILAVMLTTGLRTVSITLADVGDVRKHDNPLTGETETVLYFQGKGHTEKTKFVKLSDPVYQAIMDYLKARGGADKREPLFTSTANRNAGGRMTTHSISRICKGHLQEAGIDSDKVTAHSLRHSAAVIALANGASVEEVQIMLDHQSIDTTRIYSHMLERENNNSEYKISAALFGC